MANETLDYNKVLADLESKRDALNAAIEGIKTMLAVTSGSAYTPATPMSGEAQIENGAFFGMAIPSATEKYLRMTPRVLRSTKEISDALQQGGIETVSKKFFNTVFNAITRYIAPDGQFVKVGSKWGLAEWYPDYKPKARRGGKDESEEDSDLDPITGEPITELSSTSVS